jgi:nitrogen PTS system EIIA component
MQLTVRDASQLLKISEKELYRLIKRNEIPCFHLNRTCFFNKAELLEWAISRSVDISPEFFNSSDIAMEHLPFLADALENGGIHRITDGATKEVVLQKIVALIPGIGSSESMLLFKALLARETLGSTAIGNGIAIPHVRNPIILNLKGPSVLLCFLDNPIDFGALDKEKVSIIFTIISPTARIHLHFLARLSFLLQQDGLRKMINPDTDPDVLLCTIREIENKIDSGKHLD